MKARSLTSTDLKFVKCVRSARYLRELNALSVPKTDLCCLPEDNFFLDSEHCILVYPWVEGKSLADRLRKASVRQSIDVRMLAIRIFEAIRVVHDAGLVHGDIKPENFLLKDPKRIESTLMLADFGSSAFENELDARNWRSASPAYEAPESVEGRASRASDLYSAGVLLYEVVTGRLPYSGMPAEIFKQSKFEVPPLLMISDQALRVLLARLLATDLSIRPKSCSEVLSQLKHPAPATLPVKKPPQTRALPSLRLHGFSKTQGRSYSLTTDERAALFCYFRSDQLRVIDQQGSNVFQSAYQGPAPVWFRQYLWFWIGADLYRFDGFVRKLEWVGHFKFPPEVFDISRDGVVWISLGILFSASFDGEIHCFERVYGYLNRNLLAVTGGDVHIACGVTGSTLMRFSQRLELRNEISLEGVIIDLCRGPSGAVHLLMEVIEGSGGLFFCVVLPDGQRRSAPISAGFSSVSLSHKGCVIWRAEGTLEVLENIAGEIHCFERGRRQRPIEPPRRQKET